MDCGPLTIMELNLFKHKTKIEIRFVDMDKFKHVNNANYLTYVEQARIAYFGEAVDWKYDWSKQGVILARTEINFIVPIEFGDEIFVYTRCSRMGTKSFDLEFRMIRMLNDKEQLMADGTSVIVAFDYELNKSVEIPQDWREAILRFEEETSL